MMSSITLHVGLATLTLLAPQELAPPAAQVKAQDAAQSRAALAEEVRKAHRPDGSKTPIDSYRADLQVSKTGEQNSNIDIDLSIKFGAKIEGKKGKLSPMLRYSVNEGPKRLQRGFDGRDRWQAIGKKVSGLTDRSHVRDRRLLDTHLRLCKLMLKFLEPGTILGSLKGSEPVKEVKLKIGRSKPVDALLVRGRHPNFPVFRDSGNIRTGLVHLEAWVEKATKRLRQVKVYPIGESGLPTTHGELILLRNYVTKSGVLLPRELWFYLLDNDKRLQNASVKLKTFELNPKLSKADFARPPK